MQNLRKRPVTLVHELRVTPLVHLALKLFRSFYLFISRKCVTELKALQTWLVCTNESLNNKHGIRIKWVRKFGVCCTSYTSFGKFGTPKTNGRALKTRFSAISSFL